MTAYKDGTITGGSYAFEKFVPALWSSRILKNLHDKQVMRTLCSTDYIGEIKGMGDTVKIQGVTNVAIRDYFTNVTATPSVTYDVGGDTQMLVEIDAAKYFAFKVEDIEQAQMNAKVMSELSAEAAVAMAKVQDQYIYDKLATAAVNNTADGMGARGATSTTNGGLISVSSVSSAWGNLYNGLVDASIRLDDMLCPNDGRVVVLPSFALAYLLKDDRFINYNNAGQGEARSSRAVGSIAGFEVITLPRSTFVRFDDTGASNMYEHAAAISDKDIGGTGGGGTATVVDDYRGIFLRKGSAVFAEQLTKVENVRLEGYFADAVRGLHLWGGGVIRPQWVGAIDLDDPAFTTSEVA